MKRFLKPLLVAVLGMTGLGLSAHSVKEFPAPLPPVSAAPSEAMQLPNRAPLNTEKPLGKRLFGAMQYDLDKPAHWFKGYSNKIQQLEKVGGFYIKGDPDEEYYPMLYMIWSGAMTDTGYYAYRVNYYTFGPIIYVSGWLKVDTETGDFEMVEDLYKPEIYKTWEYVYDLAFDYNTKKLYGLAQNENGSVSSMVGEIDRADGAFTKKVASLKDYYFAMAFDYDGRPYAIRWDYDEDGEVTGALLERFDSKWNVEFSRELKVDGKAFIPNYQHGLDFDYETGELWWLATNGAGEQYVVKINPDDGSTVNYGRLGYNETGVGLHVPFTITADARTAPARVADLTYTHNDSQQVVLSWTNPTIQCNRKKLSDMEEVAIYRDEFKGEPVATVNAVGKVGEAMSWTDETAPRGVHKYYVVPCAVKGEKGVMDSISAFSGRDVPGPVQKLEATTPNGKSVVVTWERPVRGDSDGWYDDSDLSYRITRLPDNVELGTTKELRWNDIDIPEAKAYSYQVVAVNAEGDGTVTVSNRVLAGQEIIVPYSTDFATEVDATRFTPIDYNQDYQTFEYGINLSTLKPAMHFSMSDYGNDDALASPPFKLKKGKTYRAKYTFQMGGYGSYDRVYLIDVALLGGTEPAKSTLTDELAKHEDFRIEGREGIAVVDEYFTSPVDGPYYVALRMTCTDEEKDCWVDITGFEITEVEDNDLMATSLETFLNVSNEFDNRFFVNLYNNGKNTMSGYKAQVGAIDVNGHPVVFAEANGPEIASHKSARIELYGKPDRYGEVDLVAMVSSDKDEDASNDISEPVTVNVDGYTALTNTISEGQIVDNATVPLSHYFPYTVTQSYYTPAVMGLANSGDNMVISRIAFEYDSDKDINSTSVSLWLNQSDNKTPNNKTAWVAPTGTPVYQGRVDFVKGHHYLVFDLDEEHLFSFDPTKSLVITMSKEDTSERGFLVRFRNFNDNWGNDTKFFTLRAQENSPISISSPSVTNLPNAAVLHISTQDPAGVKEIVISSAASLTYDVATGMLASSEDMSKVEVYNMSGALIKTLKPAARQASVKCEDGIYIIKVTTAKGNASLKTVIKK